ncbi:MAG: PfkB family carbohydrate kinase, partial [Lactobacillus crispatus]|nr:PfkB family carbohydrate kinase [Lactobacillus crispatus]
MNICVLGSLNVDLMISTDRLPVKGETVHGNDGDYLLGGKGANQAVAASRMGIETNMIGCIGQDTFGDKILKYLSKEENLETSHIKRLNTFSGIATVFKLPSDNAIVVVPGANNLCDETVLTENQKLITNSDIFLTQLEIPLEIVSAGLKLAKSHGVITVLNPAPYQ